MKRFLVLLILAASLPAIAQRPTSNFPFLTLQNETSTGTTAGHLVKLTGAPSTAIISATSDTTNAIGVSINGGKLGTAIIQQAGTVQLAMDGATTAGDYVKISSSVAGDGSDFGTSCPGNENIGQVLSTNTGAGTYSVLLEIGYCPSSSAHTLSSALDCVAASASGTTYTCSTSPTFTPVTGDSIQFKADVASTGAATLNVNSAGAKALTKQGTTAIVANDLVAGQWADVTYDGTNWQIQTIPNGAVSLLGVITLPNTTSSSVGVYQLGGVQFAHNFGTRNAFFGQAGNFTLTGTDDTAVGVFALANITNDTQSTAVGRSALVNQAGASNDTAVGYSACQTVVLGTSNTCIGNLADVSASGAINRTAIGQGASAAADNTVQLGNTSVTNINTSAKITAAGGVVPAAGGGANSGETIACGGGYPAAGTTGTNTTGIAHQAWVTSCFIPHIFTVSSMGVLSGGTATTDKIAEGIWSLSGTLLACTATTDAGGTVLSGANTFQKLTLSASCPNGATTFTINGPTTVLVGVVTSGATAGDIQTFPLANGPWAEAVSAQGTLATFVASFSQTISVAP